MATHDSPVTVTGPPEEAQTVVAPPGHFLELTPGTVLLDRYRIISRLGKGGMGEVYRADDLRLGQPVALKFVVPRLASQQQQLLQEVRVGRKVSHPNVCRLHDIGEIGGRMFLSMEYIDGEDLASLLRRIGRLPHDKAVSLAREITAGVVAAHDCEVIHRDLKPANVMIDGRGSAHITDFGLAHLSEAGAADAFSGTPAYMAPEQFHGVSATTATDVYALGLIFFELWTGRRLFSGSSLSEIVAAHRTDLIRAAVRKAPELDSQIAAVIDVCLDEDPARRPASARALLAMLPGRDALDAAAAAGQTPSPALVAAALDRGDFGRLQAWSVFSATVIMLAILVVVGERTSLHRRIPLPYSASQLELRSREMLDALGWTAAALPRADSAGWFLRNDRFLRWREKSGTNASLVRGIFFIYRQSPYLMRPGFVNGSPMLAEEDPPLTSPGMMRLKVDSDGRLYSLTIVPPQRLATQPIATDWSRLLRLTGMDAQRLTAVTPEYASPVDSDAKAAWVGRDPLDGQPIRIEAAALRGRPVSLEVLGAWNAGAIGAVPGRRGDAIAQLLFTLVLIVFVVGAFFLLLRNMRRGQGDMKGATRIAIVMLVTMSIAGAFRAHHLPDAVAETDIASGIFMRALYLAFFTWVAYVAVEPLVRRRWPRALVSWSRLLEGRFNDPMIGRDVLIGFAGAVTMAFAGYLAVAAADQLTGTPPNVNAASMTNLTSPRYVVYFLLNNAIICVNRCAGVLLLLVLIRGIVRNERLALMLITTIIYIAILPNIDGTLMHRAIATAFVAIVPVIVLARFGFLALCATWWLSVVMRFVPVTLDVGSWYFPTTVGVLAFLLAIMAAAFHRSLGGKPLFAAPLFEE